MSWVIVNKETNEAVFETFNKKTTEKINTEKYKVVRIMDWLCFLNK